MNNRITQQLRLLEVLGRRKKRFAKLLIKEMKSSKTTVFKDLALLLRSGHVEKVEKGMYAITTRGKRAVKNRAFTEIVGINHPDNVAAGKKIASMMKPKETNMTIGKQIEENLKRQGVKVLPPQKELADWAQDKQLVMQSLRLVQVLMKTRRFDLAQNIIDTTLELV